MEISWLEKIMIASNYCLKEMLQGCWIGSWDDVIWFLLVLIN